MMMIWLCTTTTKHPCQHDLSAGIQVNWFVFCFFFFVSLLSKHTTSWYRCDNIVIFRCQYTIRSTSASVNTLMRWGKPIHVFGCRCVCACVCACCACVNDKCEWYLDALSNPIPIHLTGVLGADQKPIHQLQKFVLVLQKLHIVRFGSEFLLWIFGFFSIFESEILFYYLFNIVVDTSANWILCVCGLFSNKERGEWIKLDGHDAVCDDKVPHFCVYGCCYFRWWWMCFAWIVNGIFNRKKISAWMHPH